MVDYFFCLDLSAANVPTSTSRSPPCSFFLISHLVLTRAVICCHTASCAIKHFTALSRPIRKTARFIPTDAYLCEGLTSLYFLSKHMQGIRLQGKIRMIR
jgi:hypothetical protein